MNEPALSVDAQVRMMIAALAEARRQKLGAANIGFSYLVGRFKPAPRVFWRLVEVLSEHGPRP